MAVSVPVRQDVLQSFYVVWTNDELHTIKSFAPSKELAMEYCKGAYGVHVPLFDGRLHKFSQFYCGTVKQYNEWCADSGYYSDIIASSWLYCITPSERGWT